MGMLPPLIQQILADTTEYNAKLTEVQAKGEETAESSEASAEETGNAWAKAGLVVGAAVVAIGAVAVDLAMKYQSATANIAANADISVGAATKITNAFLGQAFQTTFSAQATAAAYAAVAGQMGTLNGQALTASQSLAFMTQAQDLAEASGTSLSSATSDLSTIMQAYKEPLSDAASVTNDLFNASRTTGVPLDSLTTTMQRLHTQLGASAPSIQDTSGLLLDMANHGETGRGAVSALTGALNGLMTPSAAVSATQQALGISFQNAQGQLLPLNQIVAIAGQSIAGMGQMQAIAQLKAEGFGSSASKLYGVIQSGASVLSTDEGLVNKVGSAHQAAAKNADTLEGSFDKVKSGVEDLVTKLGQVLIPILTQVTGAISKVIGWLEQHKTVMLILAGVIGGIVLTALAALIVSLAATAVGVIAATWPILAILAAIALLVGGFVLLYTHVTGFRDAVNTFVGMVKGAFAGAIAFVKQIVGDIANWISQNWNTIKAVTTVIWDVISTIIKVAWDIISTYIGTELTVMIAIVKVAWDVVSTVIGTAITVIVAVIKVLVAIIETIVGVVQAMVSGVSAVISTLIGVWQNVTTGISNFIGSAVAFFTGLPGKIMGALSGIYNTVGGFLSGVWNTITSDVSKFIGGIVNFFIDLPGKIASAMGSMVSAVLAKVKSAANSIPVIGGALSAIGLATGGIVTKPTLALLGETETEYVLPESQLKSGRASVQSLAALSGQAPVRSLATTGGSGGGGGVTIGQLSIPVTVPPGTTPQMAQSVGTAVQNAVQTAMAQVVRQLSAGVYHP